MKVNEGYYICQPALTLSPPIFENINRCFRHSAFVKGCDSLIQSQSSDGPRPHREPVRGSRETGAYRPVAER